MNETEIMCHFSPNINTPTQNYATVQIDSTNAHNMLFAMSPSFINGLYGTRKYISRIITYLSIYLSKRLSIPASINRLIG